ncbi:MAG TPA: hypothetical protein VEU74_12135 [Gemmatimonadales bacterium]|nr:hypothetical protein [Gemmatimonadales bacterium]
MIATVAQKPTDAIGSVVVIHVEHTSRPTSGWDRQTDMAPAAVLFDQGVVLVER